METENSLLHFAPSLHKLSKQNSKQFEVINNRINYIFRCRKKAENNIKGKKIQGLTTLASDSQHKRSIDYFLTNSSINKSGSKTLQNFHFGEQKKLKDRLEDSINCNHHNENVCTQLSVIKHRQYSQRKQQSAMNDKVIKQQKQKFISINRAKKMQVIKFQKSAKEKKDQFWQQKRRQLQTQREMKKIPSHIAEIKIQEIKMNILQAQQQSLDKLQRIISHQEQLAYKIKAKLNLL